MFDTYDAQPRQVLMLYVFVVTS